MSLITGPATIYRTFNHSHQPTKFIIQLLECVNWFFYFCFLKENVNIKLLVHIFESALA